MDRSSQHKSPAVGKFTLIMGPLVTFGMAPFGFQSRDLVQTFQSLFEGFGAELPALTLAVISHYLVFWAVLSLGLLAQIVLLVQLATTRRADIRRAFWWVVLFNAVGLLVLMVALYWPIFAMSSVLSR